MRGKIVKGIAGFYYVHVPGIGVYECKARGIFRKDQIKPLIGDNVTISIQDEINFKGNIETILPRKNELLRPTVSNIDQAVIVFSVTQPAPSLNLLDRFLVMAEKAKIEALICFNKVDIQDEDQYLALKNMYENVGYRVFMTSSLTKEGVQLLNDALCNRTTVFAGPSGVGKSSILNLIQNEMILETGIVSEKIGRGKHTTRHAELIAFQKDSYVVDTPGFSSLQLENVDKAQLKNLFIDFLPFEQYCKFKGCAHMNEPTCGIKDAIKDGEIAKSRYESYQLIYNEINDIRRW